MTSGGLEPSWSGLEERKCPRRRGDLKRRVENGGWKPGKALPNSNSTQGQKKTPETLFFSPPVLQVLFPEPQIDDPTISKLLLQVRCWIKSFLGQAGDLTTLFLWENVLHISNYPFANDPWEQSPFLNLRELFPSVREGPSWYYFTGSCSQRKSYLEVLHQITDEIHIHSHQNM